MNFSLLGPLLSTDWPTRSLCAPLQPRLTKRCWLTSACMSGRSGLVEGKIQMLFDAFKGTPTFNLAMRLSGWGVAPESIILGSLSQVGGRLSG